MKSAIKKVASGRFGVTMERPTKRDELAVCHALKAAWTTTTFGESICFK